MAGEGGAAIGTSQRWHPKERALCLLPSPQEQFNLPHIPGAPGREFWETGTLGQLGRRRKVPKGP